VDIAFAVALVGTFGVVGLAAAIAIGAWVETLLLAVILRRRVAGLDLGSVVRVGLVSTALALVGAGVAYAVNNALVAAWGEDASQVLVLVRLVVATAAGGLVVVAGAAALRMEELRTIVGVMADLMRRRGRP
jgi:peptidoglycan biosynthesis protein MviN/MurJ (putative lipid II flippase)